MYSDPFTLGSFRMVCSHISIMASNSLNTIPVVLRATFKSFRPIGRGKKKKPDPFHDQLRKIIVNICHNDYPDVSLDDFMKLDIFDDLALDSIAFIGMIVEIENEFDI